MKYFLPLILFCFSFGALAADNILYNASGEKLNRKTKLPSGWRTSADGAAGKCHFTDKNAKDGNVAFKLFSSGKISENNRVCFYQRGLGSDIKSFPSGTLMEFSFIGTTLSNPSVRFRFFVELKKSDKVVRCFNSGEKEIYFGWAEQQLQFKMPDVDYDDAVVYVQLLTGGTLIFDRLYLGKAVNEFESSGKLFPDDYCRVADFPVQNTFYGRQPIQTFKIDCKLRDDDLKIGLFGADGKKLDCSFDRKSRILKLPPLKVGNYELRFAAGNFRRTEFFRVLEKKQNISFNSNNILEINGKNIFPIIIVSPVLSHDAFRIYREIGVSAIAVRGLTDSIEYAQFISREIGKYDLDLICWSNPGGDFVDRSDSEGLQIIKKRIDAARRVKRFIGWFDDESEHRKIPFESVQKAYRSIYFQAPEYLFWANHAPRLTNKTKNHESFNSVRRYSLACDVTGIDIYPVPEGNYHSNLANKTLSCVGEYTDLLRRNAFDKPIWMTLQAFSWSDFGGSGNEPRPDYSQLRFMVYNAVTHGATGISFFGTVPIYSDYMTVFADVVKELRAVSPYIVNGRKEILGGKGAVFAVRYDMNGETLLIIVNESKEKSYFAMPPGRFYHTISGKEAAAGKLNLAGQSVTVVSSRKIIIPATEKFVKNAAEKKDPFSVKKWNAQWCDHPLLGTADNTVTFARHKYNFFERPEKFKLNITGDDKWKLFVNGRKIGSGFGHKAVYCYDLTDVVHKGENIIEVELFNISGPSGVFFEGEAVVNGKNMTVLSGQGTEFADSAKKNYKKCRLLGKPPVKPWGKLAAVIEIERKGE